MAAEERYDVLFRGGTVIDGTGAPRVRAAVAVAGDRIAAVGDLMGAQAARTIDATGRIVSPGFIDAHTHDDNLLLVDPDVTPKTSQGVTTVIAGNCGVSLAPLRPGRPVPPPLDLLGPPADFRYPRFADYVAALDETPPAANAGLLVGHSALRLDTMDDVDRPATTGEIDAMRERLAEGVKAGALGFSTGLIYGPNRAATTDEVAAVAEVAGAAGGLYVTHMRNEHDGVEEAMEEAFEIGRRAGAGVVISHHKCAGRQNFGRSHDTLALIEKTRETQAVGLDVYPYTAGSTVLLADMVEKAERVIVTWSEPHPEHAGQDLEDVAAHARPRPAGRRGEAATGGRHLLHDGRGGRPPHHGLRAQHDRLRRPAPRSPSAPPALGHLSARARPLRARTRSAHPGGCGAPHDRTHRRPVRTHRSRRSARRRLCRSRNVRCGDHRRTRRPSRRRPGPPPASTW